ncbi:MAG: PleD family two-component response regulator [Gammaproteobacteria bacterium]|jgi:PleD family two-component response regulator
MENVGAPPESQVMAVPVPQIVVVDDSPTSISLYELSIASLSVELRSFRSPLDSLLHLGDNAADLLFLDIIMREMDGLTLLKKLRDMDLHRNTSVVIVTSKDYAQDRSTAKSLGALDFLVKPLRSQEICEIICQHTGVLKNSS